MPDEFAGVIVNRVVPFFELIKLFQHRNRQHNIVFLKILDARTVMQNHVRIQHKQLAFFSRHTSPIFEKRGCAGMTVPAQPRFSSVVGLLEGV